MIAQGRKEAAEAVIVAVLIALGTRIVDALFDRAERREHDADERQPRRPPGARVSRD